MNTHSFPLVRGAASLVLAVAIVMLLPGCQTSGHMYGKVNGEIFGVHVEGEGEVWWGLPQGHLPPGSTYGGTVTMNDREVAIYRGGNGCFYMIAPGSDKFSKIFDDPFGWSDLFPLIPGGPARAPRLWHDSAAMVAGGGSERAAETPGDPSSLPWMIPPDRELDVQHEFDFDADFARLAFTLPADGTQNFRDPAEMPYALTGWGATERPDGSIDIWYEGITNDVLGAAMLQGFKSLTREEPFVGLVEIELSLEFTAAFVNVDGKHDTNGYSVIPIYESR